jgi:enamine deaminase RidA (YjgF/YER057c/UK114 family)
MPVRIHTRTRADITEFIITASLPAGDDPAPFLAAVWEPIRAAGATILLERWFGSTDARAAVLQLRATWVAAADPEPTWLGPPADRTTTTLSVVIHAVAGLPPPATPAAGVRIHRAAHGTAWATIHDCIATDCASGWDALQERLASAHIQPEHLARTWLWVDHILDRYDELNQTRTAWFRRHGLVATDHRERYLPASTAVGVRPTGGVIAIDAIAILAGARPACFAASGNQQSAFRYGSAFARAARVPGFSGDWLSISGTAAIDAAGITTNPGNEPAQIDDALRNIRAVWQEHGRTDDDVVQAIAYCATPTAATRWQTLAQSLPWPCVTVMADVCRADLPFEIEALVDLAHSYDTELPQSGSSPAP